MSVPPPKSRIWNSLQLSGISLLTSRDVPFYSGWYKTQTGYAFTDYFAGNYMYLILLAIALPKKNDRLFSEKIM
ncbi:hypothetical protein [Nostoc sp. DedSLP04]|uniref:hypothetical protein n=1 Tax=Nostoc sp. DedSLP04 TaxID=3075401 RepID=UPI002AD5012F|nr:hypothetical protein [Nostoc sp. DedSLP04]MDZ8030586.1 hypothetical protein [Nostoc sp. DedSLP04]